MPKEGKELGEFARALNSSTLATSKYESYGPVYNQIFFDLRNNPRPTILELGIASGGSLQTWRALFGDEAVVAGADMNPGSSELVQSGFEILIGDQEQSEFWDQVEERFPSGLDLVVDDGGHSNPQQMMTLLRGIPLVKPGGWIVVEDLHASWMKSFGNPSRYSTWELLSQMLQVQQRDHFATRNYRVPVSEKWKFDLTLVGTSIVAFRRAKADFQPDAVLEAGEPSTFYTRDFRFDSLHIPQRLPSAMRQMLQRLKQRRKSREMFKKVMRSISSGD